MTTRSPMAPERESKMEHTRTKPRRGWSAEKGKTVMKNFENKKKAIMEMVMADYDGQYQWLVGEEAFVAIYPHTEMEFTLQISEVGVIVNTYIHNFFAGCPVQGETNEEKTSMEVEVEELYGLLTWLESQLKNIWNDNGHIYVAHEEQFLPLGNGHTIRVDAEMLATINAYGVDVISVFKAALASGLINTEYTHHNLTTEQCGENGEDTRFSLNGTPVSVVCHGDGHVTVEVLEYHQNLVKSLWKETNREDFFEVLEILQNFQKNNERVRVLSREFARNYPSRGGYGIILEFYSSDENTVVIRNDSDCEYDNIYRVRVAQEKIFEPSTARKIAAQMDIIHEMSYKC